MTYHHFYSSRATMVSVLTSWTVVIGERLNPNSKHHMVPIDCNGHVPFSSRSHFHRYQQTRLLWLERWVPVSENWAWTFLPGSFPSLFGSFSIFQHLSRRCITFHFSVTSRHPLSTAPTRSSSTSPPTSCPFLTSTKFLQSFRSCFNCCQTFCNLWDYWSKVIAGAVFPPPYVAGQPAEVLQLKRRHGTQRTLTTGPKLLPSPILSPMSQEKEILWIPVLTFENTENKPFTLADEKTSITVKKQGEFSLSKVRCWGIVQTKYNISFF